MSYAKDILGDQDYFNFEVDMTSMKDLELEYTEAELELLYQLFGVKD